MADQVDSTSTQSAIPKSAGDAEALLKNQSGPGAARNQAGLFRRFMGLVRFSHTLFALPFALLACVLALTAPGLPSLSAFEAAIRILAVVLCMVFARSAAMAFNRVVDAEFDAQNPRTAQRHLPAGTLSFSQVLLFLAANCILFVISCGLFLPNWLPLAFSIPVLSWICGYSLAKRFTSAAHLWLGLALALAPICAWVAIRGEVLINSPGDVLPACSLAIAIALWVAGFDIIYACQDAEFDRRVGLRSIPARLGIANALRVSALLHVLMLICLAALPILFPELSLGGLYYAGLLLVGVLIVRQHAIVRPNDLQRVGVAFFNINAMISLGLCTLAALDALWR